MQTDPIGQSGGINLYAYVGGDPVNFTDPWGLRKACVSTDGGPPVCTEIPDDIITVTTQRPSDDCPSGAICIPGSAIGLQTCLFGSCSTIDIGFDGFQVAVESGVGAQSCQGVGGPDSAFVAAPAAQSAPRVSNGLRARLMRSAGLYGAMLAGGARRIRPEEYWHYGYASDAGKFASGLRPGSFATIPTGTPMTGPQAQSLLALPHPTPPDSYYKVTVFRELTPVIGPSPVAPDFGQPGGGVEFTFPEGTPPGSVTGPFPLSCTASNQ